MTLRYKHSHYDSRFLFSVIHMKVVLSLHNFIFGKESNLFILPKLWRDNSQYQLKRNTKNKMMVIFQAASGMILNCSWAS